MDIKVNTDHFTQFQKRYDNSLAELPAALRLALKSGLIKMETQMKKNVSGGMLKRSSGTLEKEITHQVFTSKGTLTGKVGLPYKGNQGDAFYGLFFEHIKSMAYLRHNRTNSGVHIVHRKIKRVRWHTSVVDKMDGIIFNDLAGIAGKVFDGK